MNRLVFLPIFTGFLAFVGCGSDSDPVAEAPASPQSETVTATPVAVAPVSQSPADVVSQFLDEIRRGGEDTRANELLTQKANSELKRIGQSVQPIGSPDARFEVTRFENVPNDPSSALVHSIWSEPNEDGTSSQYQVVWAVHQESAAWRISGLAMELNPNEPPMVIDFENGDLMAKLLSPPATENQPVNPAQATSTEGTISR
ncbi:MAG: hypothetical protein GY904_35555 [Planctomycetaceae bacterium]|jgi:hypothetical protein|nr:hypothetical protein [Planctomycetaceae bacterium]